MAITAAYVSNLTVTEELPNNTTSFNTASNRTVTHNAISSTATLNASSSPAVSKVASFRATLSSGALTIDLTSLTGTNGATVSLSGLKVQAIKFKAASGNGNPITVTPGAANDYQIGGASMSWALSPGDELLYKGNESAPDVGATDKTLDLAGTGSSDYLDITIVAG